MERAVDIGRNFLGEGSPLAELENVGGLVSTILQAGIAIAGIVLLFLLVGGGIAIISGAGNDNPEQAAKGKQAVTSALIGFIVVFASYWIVQLIELITGINLI